VANDRAGDDSFRPGSATRCVLDRVADKWTVLILSILRSGPQHFLKLHRSIGDVSRKVLTESLRRVERDGLIKRGPRKESSTVVYSLSESGRSLCAPIDALRRWAEQNADLVQKSQRAYDAAHRASVVKN
jgi:DNA-binding HxlR family transcriptional regulator